MDGFYGDVTHRPIHPLFLNENGHLSPVLTSASRVARRLRYWKAVD
jgi:hypothetical protein